MCAAYIPTDLELCIASMLGVFQKYAGTDDDSSHLSNAELKTLLNVELPGYLQNTKDASQVEKLMQQLDNDRDGQVDFKEFIVFIAAITAACYDVIAQQATKSKKK